MSAKILCPHCGTEFEWSDGTHASHAIPSDGTYFLIPKTNSSKNVPMDAIMNFINNFNDIIDSNTVANETIVDKNSVIDSDLIISENTESTVTDNDFDEIEASIKNDGYIPNNQLWRRWVMAQMLRHCGTNGQSTFDSYFVSGTSYKYQWTTILDEFKVLNKLNGQELINRERFFNLDVARETAKDYVKKMSRYLRCKAKRRYDAGYNGTRKNPTIKDMHMYVTIPQNRHHDKIYMGKKTISVDNSKNEYTFAEYMTLINQYANSIINATTYAEAISAIKDLIADCPMTLPMSKSAAWKNAFKGAGAYYTMDNMIKFHNCRFFIGENNMASLDASLHHLETITNQYNQEKAYYKLYAIMLKFVESNNFDFDTVMKNINNN